jgi:CRP-like cAMP-binding protein
MTSSTEHGAAHVDQTPRAPFPLEERAERLPQPVSAVDRGNFLLRGLDAAGWSLIEPHLKPAALTPGDLLEERGRRAPFLYFPISGAVSIEAGAPRGKRMQMALVGREGMVGTSLLLDGDAANQARVMFGGPAWRLSANDLAACLALSPALHRQLLGGVNTFIARLVLTALANGQGTIEQRLARWLLIAADRLDTELISITHEALSDVLGVRRAGVTVALHILEGKQALRSERRHIRILNHEKLTLAAGPYRPQRI